MKKLSLNRETILAIETSQLEEANGAGSAPATHYLVCLTKPKARCITNNGCSVVICY